VNRIALRTTVASLALASMFAPAKLSAQDPANAPKNKGARHTAERARKQSPGRSNRPRP
jgi:TRAP-type C4-dicarboxylate transport system substrate-binding protein